MAGSRVISAWPTVLADTRLRAGVQADAELAQALAGRARWLYEMATGGPAVAGVPAGVPQNPQGLLGHDHSGPPFGSCFRHRIFGFCGTVHDAESSGNWDQLRNVYDLSTSSISSYEWSGRVWVRPHARREGAPYSQGEIAVRARAASGSRVIDVNWTTNASLTGAESFTATTTATTFLLTEKMRLVPGWNSIRISLTTTSSAVVRVVSLAVMQVAKRSH